VNIIVILNRELEVTQGHWNWCHSKAWVWFSIRVRTMAVFLAVSEISSIKQWHNRENWVMGRSRSFKWRRSI